MSIENRFNEPGLDMIIRRGLLNNESIERALENRFYMDFENDYKKYKEVSPITFREKIFSENQNIKSLLEQANNIFEKQTGITMFTLTKLSKHLNKLNLPINYDRLKLIGNKVASELKTEKSFNINKINSVDWLNSPSTSGVKLNSSNM